MSTGRPSRPPRRDGGSASGRPPARGGSERSSYGSRGSGASSDGRRSSGGGRPGGSGGRSGSSGGRPGGGGGGRGAPGRGRPRGAPAPRRELTAAERKAAEVNATRPIREPRDPEAERERIESRSLEEWIDDGAIRTEASNAASRAAAAPRPARAPRAVEPTVAATIGTTARDKRRAAVLTDRLAQAQEALDRERFDDARRIAMSLVRELGNVAAVHEVLGLTAYRTGKWKQAAAELEAAQALHPSVALLPVLADVYRAQRRWADVERVWTEVREVSPSQEVLAEARMVVAGAQADQGDLKAALRTMGTSSRPPKKVRDHHLRQWYVLGDLHDRAGDPIEATRWFELVATHDRDFVDVADRLRALGR